AALHGAAAAACIADGDDVITTPLSFVASSNCVLYRGGSPRFVDVDAATWNLDSAAAARAVSDGTRAVVSVSLTGLPVDLEPLTEVRDRVVVIEDASHALGAIRAGDRVGGPHGADLTTFSLHPVKSMTTGEGGMVTTESPELANHLRRFRTHGISRDPDRRAELEGDWHYDVEELG